MRSSVISKLSWVVMSTPTQPDALSGAGKDLSVTCVPVFPALAHFQSLSYQLSEEVAALF